MTLRASLAASSMWIALCFCGTGCSESNEPYVPVHCDESFRTERAGIWASSDGTLEIAQADDTVTQLCGYAANTTDFCPHPDWILEIRPEFAAPGVYMSSWPADGPAVSCFECQGDPGDGASGNVPDLEATVEITAIDDEHVAGCIVGASDGPCVQDDIAFDVPCPAENR